MQLPSVLAQSSGRHRAALGGVPVPQPVALAVWRQEHSELLGPHDERHPTTNSHILFAVTGMVYCAWVLRHDACKLVIAGAGRLR